MTKNLRPDGKPFVFDKRGAAPRYVVEDDKDGCPVVCNQFTGTFEVISKRRPYSRNQLVHALRRLKDADQ